MRSLTLLFLLGLFVFVSPMTFCYSDDISISVDNSTDTSIQISPVQDQECPVCEECPEPPKTYMLDNSKMYIEELYVYNPDMGKWMVYRVLIPFTSNLCIDLENLQVQFLRMEDF